MNQYIQYESTTWKVEHVPLKNIPMTGNDLLHCISSTLWTAALCVDLSYSLIYSYSTWVICQSTNMRIAKVNAFWQEMSHKPLCPQILVHMHVCREMTCTTVTVTESRFFFFIWIYIFIPASLKFHGNIPMKGLTTSTAVMSLVNVPALHNEYMMKL